MLSTPHLRRVGSSRWTWGYAFLSLLLCKRRNKRKIAQTKKYLLYSRIVLVVAYIFPASSPTDSIQIRVLCRVQQWPKTFVIKTFVLAKIHYWQSAKSVIPECSLRTNFLWSSPIQSSTSCVRYPEIIPLRMSLSVQIGTQVQLVIGVRDFYDFPQVSGFESRLKVQVRATILIRVVGGWGFVGFWGNGVATNARSAELLELEKFFMWKKLFEVLKCLLKNLHNLSLPMGSNWTWRSHILPSPALALVLFPKGCKMVLESLKNSQCA